MRRRTKRKILYGVGTILLSLPLLAVMGFIVAAYML